MATATHTENHDHTSPWTWAVDLIALLAAISPALIYIAYLLL